MNGSLIYPACKCGEMAVSNSGPRHKCAKHYRFFLMRMVAKRDSKLVPSYEQLENMASHLRDMKCPHCSIAMNWLSENGHATTVSLQHYRSGSMGFLCVSCNSRHSQQPADEFMSMPATHKKCPCCQNVLHLNDFYKLQNSKNFGKSSTYCRICTAKKNAQFQRDNHEKFAEYSRRYRAKKKVSRPDKLDI